MLAVSLKSMLRPEALLFLSQLQVLHLAQWQSRSIKFEKESEGTTKGTTPR